jgi:hypothetical protein
LLLSSLLFSSKNKWFQGKSSSYPELRHIDWSFGWEKHWKY